MKTLVLISIPFLLTATAARSINPPHDPEDTIHNHQKEVLLDEIEVVGVAGTQCLKSASAPFTVVTRADMARQSTANLLDIVSRNAGVSQISTGAGIGKPVIRGLGYNRVVVVEGGVRQEGQQWGDEHGLEVDAAGVWSVEVLKGPASLMYGSDAIAGVMVLQPAPLPADGETLGEVVAEYNTNNALQSYSANVAGNASGFLYSLTLSHKQAQPYTNRYDHRVPGTQYRQTSVASTL